MYNYAIATAIWNIAPNVFNYTTHYESDLPFRSLLGGIKSCWYVSGNPQNTLSFDQSKCETLIGSVSVGIIVGIGIILSCCCALTTVSEKRLVELELNRMYTDKEYETVNTTEVAETVVEITNMSAQGFSAPPEVINPEGLTKKEPSAPGGLQIEGMINP